MSKNIGDEVPNPSTEAFPIYDWWILSRGLSRSKVPATIQRSHLVLYIFFFPSPWKRRRNWGLAASHHTQYDPERSNWTQKCSGLLFRSCTEIIKPIINFHLLGLWPKSESQIAINASSSITQCHTSQIIVMTKIFIFQVRKKTLQEP